MDIIVQLTRRYWIVSRCGFKRIVLQLTVGFLRSRSCNLKIFGQNSEK